MGVGADHGRDPAVQVPAQGDFFRGGLGVKIHQHHLGLDLLQDLVGKAEGVVVRRHEDAALQINHGVSHAFTGAAFIYSGSGEAGGKVGGTQHPACRTGAVGGFEVLHDLALVPDVV